MNQNIPLQTNEDIRSIKGYEGLYSITSFGYVWRHTRAIKCKNDAQRFIKGKFLKFKEDNKGYLQIKLAKNGKNRYFRVHSLVASHFIENILNLPEVNHKDTNKQNNRKDNLEWCTQQENANHAVIHNLHNRVSKFYGIDFRKNIRFSKKPWRVSVWFNKKTKHVGMYKTELEAAKAYNNFIIENNLNRPLNNL